MDVDSTSSRTPDDAQCWVCLQSATAQESLRRNPTGCTCTTGGWIHRACMASLASHTSPGHRLRMSYTDATVSVSCLHAPCRQEMQLATIYLPRYHKFLEELSAGWLMAFADTWRHEGPWYACLLLLGILATLYTVIQPNIFRLVFAVLVLCVPFHTYEVLQRPELIKFAMYGLALAFLLPRTEIHTKMLFLYAVIWRAWLRRQYVEWVDRAAKNALSRE